LKHELENKESQIGSLEISSWNTKVHENTKAQENVKTKNLKTKNSIRNLKTMKSKKYTFIDLQTFTSLHCHHTSLALMWHTTTTTTTHSICNFKAHCKLASML